MTTSHSKSAFLRRQVRRRLQDGRYLPGERIDPTSLATEFHTSPTPVRFALYRLVGEGLIVDCARSGLYVPLPTEVEMRDLYDWMERLLLMACHIVGQSSSEESAWLVPPKGQDDPAELTWNTFDAMARATRHRSLHRAVRRANDMLAPVRRAKQPLLHAPSEEIHTIRDAWNSQDTANVERALAEYFQHRKRLVPRVVELLNETSKHLN